MFHTIEEALEDLKSGKVVIVVDDENRENEGDFVGLGEKVTPEMVNMMAKEGRGLICTPISQPIAEKLGLQMMTEKNTEKQGTAFTISIDHHSTSTGISAFERARTIQEIANVNSTADDFLRPGHVFPLIAKSGGVLERDGHTEAAVDLAKLAGMKPVGVICEIMNEDGTMARLPELQKMAPKLDLKLITIQALMEYRRKHENLVKREVEITLPTRFGDFKTIGYTEVLSGKEHIALVKGDITTDEPVLVRVHSECLTGDVFGSYRCDCGPQLAAALAQIAEEGRGILLYMRQEGRGIGLMNKLKAYKLQEQGFDTVEANHQLGFRADMRDYGISAHILMNIGVNRLRLLTNNPLKISGLQDYGLEVVERVPIEMPSKKENELYLRTKAEKMGHLLHL